MHEDELARDHKFYLVSFMMKYLAWWSKSVVLALVCVVSLMWSLASAQWNPDNPYKNPSDDGNAWKIAVPGAKDSKGTQDSLVNVIKWWVNRLLGILALIALIILMYWGFQMVTSAGDDGKYEAWFTILKHAALWLILIGVAWFIVSIIFWLVNQTTDKAWWWAWTGT